MNFEFEIARREQKWKYPNKMYVQEKLCMLFFVSKVNKLFK